MYTKYSQLGRYKIISNLYIWDRLNECLNHVASEYSQLLFQVLIARKALIIETTSFPLTRFPILGDALVSIEFLIKYDVTALVVAINQ